MMAVIAALVLVMVVLSFLGLWGLAKRDQQALVERVEEQIASLRQDHERTVDLAVSLLSRKIDALGARAPVVTVEVLHSKPAERSPSVAPAAEDDAGDADEEVRTQVYARPTLTSILPPRRST